MNLFIDIFLVFVGTHVECRCRSSCESGILIRATVGVMNQQNL